MLIAPRVSAVISADEGGTLSNGRVTLTFPAGALDKDTEITIEMLGHKTLGVELSPHGIQFNEPVVMTKDLRGTTAEGKSFSTSTVWYNESLDQWELMEKVESGDADLNSANLYHFSTYDDIVG